MEAEVRNSRSTVLLLVALAAAWVLAWVLLRCGVTALQRHWEEAAASGKQEGPLAVLIPVEEEPVQAAPASRYAPVTEAERELIARMVWLEARGESAEGQQAVAEVILNRVAAGNFPDTVEAVLLAPGQFSPAALLEEATPGEAQYRAVDAALWGESILPMDVVYFSRGAENDRVWGTIGGHVFCRQYVW